MTQAERLCRDTAHARTDWFSAHGRWPTAAEVAPPPPDPWGHPLYVAIDRATAKVTVRSDGVDERPGTADDIEENRWPDGPVGQGN